LLNSEWKHLGEIISPEHEGIPLRLRFILRVRHFLLHIRPGLNLK
jgi:hypothetical protein